VNESENLLDHDVKLHTSEENPFDLPNEKNEA